MALGLQALWDREMQNWFKRDPTIPDITAEPRPKKPKGYEDVYTRRIPFSYGDTFPDAVAKALYIVIPPTNPNKNLPIYWFYTTQEAFLNQFKNLGLVVWSRRSSYHMLVINGIRVMRLWTINKTPRLQVTKVMYDRLTSLGMKLTTLEGKKEPYYYAYATITTKQEVLVVARAVKEIYGI